MEGRERVRGKGKSWREGKELEGRERVGGKGKSWREGKELEGRERVRGKGKGKGKREGKELGGRRRAIVRATYAVRITRYQGFICPSKQAIKSCPKISLPANTQAFREMLLHGRGSILYYQLN